MLEIKNLTKSFGEKSILKEFSFKFSDKGVYLLLGESGVGKTTLLRMIGGLDNDYRGEIMVALHNHSLEEQKVSPKERIAQLVVAPFLKAEFFESETLNETVRGEGGFGSTGTK